MKIYFHFNVCGWVNYIARWIRKIDGASKRRSYYAMTSFLSFPHFFSFMHAHTRCIHDDSCEICLHSACSVAHAHLCWCVLFDLLLSFIICHILIATLYISSCITLPNVITTSIFLVPSLRRAASCRPLMRSKRHTANSRPKPRSSTTACHTTS
jgi:hypothetical protein